MGGIFFVELGFHENCFSLKFHFACVAFLNGLFLELDFPETVFIETLFCLCGISEMVFLKLI